MIRKEVSMRIFTSIIITIALILATTASSGGFILKSTSFMDKGAIPSLYTCNGKNIPPALSWSNPPKNTQSYILTFTSPDSPFGLNYLWVLYNIPANIKSLEEGGDNLPDGTIVGKNDMADSSYIGPCPPDTLLHPYIFTLYALDTVLDLSADANVDKVLDHVKHHVLEQAQLIGVFNH